MTAYVKRPRVLASVLVAVLLLSGAAAAIAQTVGDPADGYAVLLPAGDPVELTDEERAAATQIILESDRLASLTESPTEVSYVVEDAVPGVVAGFEKAVAMRIIATPPVASAGPWTTLTCQGTRSIEWVESWRGVRELAVVVDLESGEILQLSVAAPPPEDAVEVAHIEGNRNAESDGVQGTVRFRDLVAGTEWATDNPTAGDLACPAGTDH